MSKTVERIAKVLVDFRDLDPATIKRETAFKDMGLDSLDIVDLVMKVEDEFKVQIPMSDQFKTVGDVADFIDNAVK